MIVLTETAYVAILLEDANALLDGSDSIAHFQTSAILQTIMPLHPPADLQQQLDQPLKGYLHLLQEDCQLPQLRNPPLVQQLVKGSLPQPRKCHLPPHRSPQLLLQLDA